MTITIGKSEFATRKPKKLDATLEASTGCNAAEIARTLMGYPSAGQVATALRPFLPDDAPSVSELAVRIGVPDTDLIVAVRKLYAGDLQDDAVAGVPENLASK